MSEQKFTPGPWEYVPSTEHHGPYVEGPHGGTICDCYTMSNVREPAVCNGGTSKPMPFFHEMADPNARLIAASPDLLAALKLCAAVCAGETTWKSGLIEALEKARDAIAKAEGKQ